MTPDYTVLAQDIKTGELLAELPWTSIAITEGRNAVGSGTLTLPMRDQYEGGVVSPDIFGAGRSAFIVLRGGIPVGKFFIDGLSMSYPGQITVRGFGALGYMGRRQIRAALNYTNVDQFEIVRDLVDRMQSTTAGDIGILVTQGNAGFTRTRSYPAQEQIAYLSALQELAETSNGFTWTEGVGDASSGYQPLLNLSNDALSVSDVRFDLEKNLRSLSVGISTANMVNHATTWSKSQEGAEQVSRRSADANALAVYPQYDAGEQTNFEPTDTANLIDRATEIVGAYSNEVRTFTFDVEQDIDSDYSRYSIGSVARLTARYGYLNHNADKVLVQSRELSVDNSGLETVRVGATAI